MRYIRYAFLAVLAVILVVLALANSGPVTLHTLPAGLAEFPGAEWLAVSLEMPVYMALFAGIVLGLMIGFAWEWLREFKYRSTAVRKESEVKKLERQLKRTQAERDKDKDEVLAILDQAS